jgi:hypothetical protein
MGIVGRPIAQIGNAWQTAQSPLAVALRRLGEQAGHAPKLGVCCDTFTTGSRCVFLPLSYGV